MTVVLLFANFDKAVYMCNYGIVWIVMPFLLAILSPSLILPQNTHQKFGVSSSVGDANRSLKLRLMEKRAANKSSFLMCENFKKGSDNQFPVQLGLMLALLLSFANGLHRYQFVQENFLLES